MGTNGSFPHPHRGTAVSHIGQIMDGVNGTVSYGALHGQGVAIDAPFKGKRGDLVDAPGTTTHASNPIQSAQSTTYTCTAQLVGKKRVKVVCK